MIQFDRRAHRGARVIGLWLGIEPRAVKHRHEINRFVRTKGELHQILFQLPARIEQRERFLAQQIGRIIIHFRFGRLDDFSDPGIETRQTRRVILNFDTFRQAGMAGQCQHAGENQQKKFQHQPRQDSK